MDWLTYRGLYDTFCASLGGSGLLAYVGSKVLEDFPNNLPRRLRESVCEGMTRILTSAEEVDNESGTHGKWPAVSSNADTSKQVKCARNEEDSDFLWHSLCLAIGELGMSKGLEWGRVARAHQLVMIFAYLDAFFSDSIRAICEARPEVLRRNRQMAWRDILQQGDWDSLCELLVEEFILELCRQGVVRRLEALQNELSLSLDIPRGDLQTIQYAELVRHIIVHAGGQVTPEFLKRAGPDAEGLKIGDLVPMELDFLARANHSALMIGSALLTAIGKKYFGIDVGELERVWKGPSEPRSG